MPDSGDTARPPSIGQRVVVRRALGPGGTAPFTDLLGELVALDPHQLTVLTRRGRVTVARAEVVAAKAVPAAPIRRAGRSAQPTPPERP